MHIAHGCRPPGLIFAFGAHVFITLAFHAQSTYTPINAAFLLYSQDYIPTVVLLELWEGLK